MATIGTLALSVIARTRNFQRGMRRSRRGVSDFRDGVLRATRRVVGFAGAITALAGAGSIGMLVRNQMRAIDATTKLADRIGATTEGVAGLEHQSALAGVSTQNLHRSLERMTRRLGQAAQGTGEAQRGLERMGLSAEELVNMRADAAFGRIAEGISQIETRAEQAAVAADIFGRSGVELVNMLAQGESGMRAAREEAERLGLTFDREAGAKVEMANDAMTRIGATIRGVGRSLAIELAPFISAAGDRLAAMGASGEGMGARVTSGFEMVLRSAAKLADLLQLPRAAFFSLQAGASHAIAAIGKSVVWLSDMFWQHIQRMMNIIGKLERFLPASFGNAMDSMRSHIQEGREFLATLDAGFDDLSDSASASFNKATDAMHAFTSGENERRVTAFFKGVRSDAAVAAADIARRAGEAGGAFAGLGDEDGVMGGQAGARQIVRSRTAVGAGRTRERKQEVTSPQLATMIELLRQISGRGVAGSMA